MGSFDSFRLINSFARPATAEADVRRLKTRGRILHKPATIENINLKIYL